MQAGFFPSFIIFFKPACTKDKGRKMKIDSKITVRIKTDKKGENVSFSYHRKDLHPLEDTESKLLVMYAEQIIRSMIETGMIAPKIERKEDGKDIPESAL